MCAHDAGGATGGTKYYKNYCDDQVKKIVDQTKDFLNNLAENVCLAYLEEQSVIDQFKTKKTAVIGAFAATGESLDKKVVESYFSAFLGQIGSIINAFMASSYISEANLFQFEKKVLTAFEKSSMFQYYDSINSIEKLKKRVKKIDD